MHHVLEYIMARNGVQSHILRIVLVEVQNGGLGPLVLIWMDSLLETLQTLEMLLSMLDGLNK